VVPTTSSSLEIYMVTVSVIALVAAAIICSIDPPIVIS